MSALAVSDGVEPQTKPDGKLDVADLVRMFEESEEATLESRGLAERDRDYYDNIQLTAEELAALKKRGQPPVIDNRIKSKIDYLIGMEKQQRIDPRALPRTPAHEEDANGASQALKYVADSEDFDAKRSAVWKNLLIEGCAGISVCAEPGYDGQMEIVLRRWAWDRMFADPHSSEPDYSDAGYLGGVIWMDYNDAVAQYPDKQDVLDTTMSDRASLSQTYDDKPKFRLWADKKRKRVRVVQMWLKRDKKWYFAEFTKTGILKAGPSPYVDDKGESDCEMLFQSAYVNRENERYGLVREMISLQDAINKRGSKSLHLLNTAQIVTEDGAVNNVEATRREAARADGVIVVNPGFKDKFEFHTRTDLAEGHFKLLQDAKNSIDLKGPNATMMGDKAQGSSAASGRAILASQQGGMIQLGDLMDNLRHLDKRVFRAIWNRIRQFWTAEKWVRITDEERNVKWVGINVDPMQVQQHMQMNPDAVNKIVGVVSNVAELDCDIIIDEAPDGLLPAVEQFEALVQLKQFDANNEIPFRAVVAAAPNLKDKQRFLEAIDKRAEEAANNPQPNPEVMKIQAMAQAKQEEAQLNAQLSIQQQAIDEQTAAAKIVSDERAAMVKAESDSRVAAYKAEQQAKIDAFKAEQDIRLKREVAAAEHEITTQRASHEMKLSTDKHVNEGKAKGEAKKQEAEPVAKMMGDVVSGLTEAVEAFKMAALAPKRVIRDSANKVVGVEAVV